MGTVRVSVADLMLSVKYVILQQSHESSAGWLLAITSYQRTMVSLQGPTSASENFCIAKKVSSTNAKFGTEENQF